MATNETIIANGKVLAWQGTSSTDIQVDDDATVTNSFGNPIWYWHGSTPRISLPNSGVATFQQGPDTVIYNFGQSSTGAAQITLTVTGKPAR